MIMEHKIVFIDVDGTLISYKKYLPDSAIMAIKTARNHGHKIVLCTGRSAVQIIPEIFNIGFDGYILGNGAYIAYQKKLIKHTPIPENVCDDIKKYFLEKDIAYYLETNDGLFLSDNFEEKGNMAFKKYARFLGNKDYMNVTCYDTLIGITSKPFNEHKVNRISYVLDSKRTYEDTMEAFPMLNHGVWGGANINPIFGYLCMKNISKGDGIKEILDVCDISVYDSISIGDSNIDISMFNNTNYSVCMGNGSDDAKRLANYVTDDLDNDGLYKAFRYLDLI